MFSLILSAFFWELMLIWLLPDLSFAKFLVVPLVITIAQWFPSLITYSALRKEKEEKKDDN